MPIRVEFMKQADFLKVIAVMRKYITDHPARGNESYAACKELLVNMGTLLKHGTLDKNCLPVARDEASNTIQAIGIITRSESDAKIHIDLICNAPWNFVAPPSGEANAPTAVRGGPRTILASLLAEKGVDKLTLDPAGDGPRKAFGNLGFTAMDKPKGHMQVLKGKLVTRS